MTSGQSTTLSLVVVVAVLAVALGRPTKGFWSALFTHRPVSFELGDPLGLSKVPNMQDPAASLDPETRAKIEEQLKGRKPSAVLRRP